MFQGVKLDGVGFTLPREEARLLLRDPRNEEVVKPYLVGEDLNTSPTLSPARFVIDFDERGWETASQFTEAMSIVEERVKPSRQGHSEERCRREWWKFQRTRPELRAAQRRLTRCLVISAVSKHHLVAFQGSEVLFAHALNVFLFDDWFSFAVLQSRVHQFWARNANLGSTMKTDARYTPSSCFETFPFPHPTDAQRVAVAAAGEALYEHRSALMLHFDEGMTKIWNRLLADDQTDLGILRLRELRDAMDRAVLDAYGWSDLSPDDTPTIVKRLRALNTERAAEEKRRG